MFRVPKEGLPYGGGVIAKKLQSVLLSLSSKGSDYFEGLEPLGAERMDGFQVSHCLLSLKNLRIRSDRVVVEQCVCLLWLVGVILKMQP